MPPYWTIHATGVCSDGLLFWKHPDLSRAPRSWPFVGINSRFVQLAEVSSLALGVGGSQVGPTPTPARLASPSQELLLIILYIYIYINLFVLFLAVLGLCCCTQAFSSCGERGLLFVVARGLLIAVASLVAEHSL